MRRFTRKWQSWTRGRARGLRRRRDRFLGRWTRRWRRARAMASRLVPAALALILVGLAAASSCGGPPRNPEDLCAIFDEKRSWYRATRRSAKKWGVPEPVQMSILYQESGFRKRIRPPRRRFLWIFPGPRPSSAYGYGQVIESTWTAFQTSTGRRHAERDDFGDVAHFVGWYGDQIHRATGVAKDDAFALYLAYHEGPRGYLLGRHREKQWLVDSARRVESRARRFDSQYDGCRRRLERWWILW